MRRPISWYPLRKVESLRKGTRLSGVYILYRNGKPIYVGCTGNLKLRLNGHRHRNFDKFRFIRGGTDYLEAALIYRYENLENKVNGWKLQYGMRYMPPIRKTTTILTAK